MEQNNTQTLERYLTEEEERILFKKVNTFGDVYSRRDSAWMLLFRQTGIRIGTMARLTVGDAKQAIRTKKLILRNEICKGKKGYTVHANTTAIKALKKLLSIRAEMGAINANHEPLVVSRKHKAMSVRSYQARLKYWRDEAGLQIEVTPHFFRHTFAHRIIERSTAANPLQVAQAALGHSDIKNTAIYTRPNREQMAADMEAIS